jgi:hypothetical protein
MNLLALMLGLAFVAYANFVGYEAVTVSAFSALAA